MTTTSKAESANQFVLEMAREVWQSKLARADDIDDISEVFREVFKESIPSSGSPYFKDTYTSQVVSLDKLVAREPADPDRVKHAHEYMVAAREGSGEKRKPISVIDMGNGKFKVLDGNTTLQALRELGETEAVVEVKKSLKQQVADPKSLDDVYQNAEKALPDFKAWIERYAADTKAAKVMMRPGLKGKERAAQKVANDYGGVAARLTDVIGATLLYDSVDQVAAALNKIGKDQAVFKVKNRYENPTPDGYRDVLMVVQVGGHLCELQLNTQAMLDAKEKGLGHKIYEIIRQIEPLTKAPDFENESDMTALGYMQSLRNLSVKVYRNAAMSSSSSSASSMASDSEMGLEFNRILARLSSSSTTFQVSGLRESIRKMLPVDFSMAKGESSFSTKSNSRFMDVPPFDAGNITRNGQKVKAKLETGKKDQVYLNNDTPLVVQWAVVEADDLVSSHDTDFRLNPEFPQELQPRDRTREEMKKQIFSISGKLNPELLGQSLYASAGAPIVGRDLVVESGNGRMLGLKMRYAQDGATAYREWVGENAKQFGIDPKTIDAMQRPVLVRIRLSEQDRKMVTERANERDIAAMSPVETAKVDSGRLQPEDMELFRPGDDGEIATAANNDFISQFLKTIGPAESAGLLTADGKPTRQLLDRIQAAVFEKAYHDERLLALMAEDANPDIRNVLKALTMASTVFAKVKGMVGDKEPIEAIDHIVGAVDVIRRAKREGENVETILNQFGLFGEDIPEETAFVTRFLVKNARSAKRIGEFLQAVAKKYQYWAANQDQPDLFGNLPEKPVVSTVLKEALADGGGGNQPGLFEDASSVHPEIDGMRVAVSVDVNQAPLDVPPNWIVFNAPRPLYGDREWQGDFLHGRFYAAVDPNGDKAEWCIKENKGLDAWVYQFVDTETMRAMVRQNYIDGYFKGDTEKTDKAMARLTEEQIREAFANFLDKMTFGAFQGLEAKAVAQQESNTKPGKEPWRRLAIMEAKTMDDIAAIFEDLFGVYLDGRDVMESALFESADGGDFVASPNGSINFGQITPEIAKVIKRQAGYIRMREGSIETTGEKHINRERRLAQIRAAGFKNAIDLVYTIASGYTEIYKGPGRQLILVNSNKQPITAYVLLEPAKDGDYYDVKTAFPTNTAFLERKELLWGDPPYHQRRNLAPSGDLGHSKSDEKISPSASDVNTILEDVFDEVLESAQVRTPSTVEENIQRGMEAMKRVIAKHVNEPRAMYRQDLGWIAFYWGEPGGDPPKFKGGYGISHILAKRDWEGKHVKELLGQEGIYVAYSLIDSIAKGRIVRRGKQYDIIYNDIVALLRVGKDGREQIWVLTGYLSTDTYTVFESSGELAKFTDYTNSTHTWPTHTRPCMGAEDSNTCDEKLYDHGSGVNMIHEDALVFEMAPETWRQAIQNAKDIADIEAVFRSLFPDAFSGEAEIQYVDTGEKIGGAKKDIWASILSGQRRMDAQALEGMDDATAAKAVTRQNVVRGLIDTFRDSGFEPGAVFMISKLIGSFDAKPADSDAARRSYVIASERVMQYLRSARTVSDFRDVLQQIRSEMAGLSMTPEQKALDADYKDRVRQWNDLHHRKWNELTHMPELHTSKGIFKRDQAFKMIDDWQAATKEDILPHALSVEYAKMIHDLRKDAENNPDSFLNQYRALGKGFLDAVSLKSKTFQKHLNDAKAGNITDFSFLDKETPVKGPRTKQDKPKWRRAIPDAPERTGGMERKFSPQELIDLFGIRGVEYGNWMDRESSEHHTQMLGYGFMDMAQVLGIPLNHVSHGGKLAVAFGARGGGSAAAHYEPDRKVINLTKLRGGGTLAHEWGHFLDNIIQMVASGGKEKFTYASGNSAAELAWRKKDDRERKRIPKPFADGVPESVQQALISLHEAIMRGDAGGKASDPQKNKYRSIGWVDELVQKGMSPQEIMDKSYRHELKGRFMGRVSFADLAAYIQVKTGQQVTYDKKHSQFYAASVAMTSSRTPDSYWTRPHEMLARAFEAYINDKLQASGIVNTYLVSGVRESDLDDTAPYPRGEERSRINAAFDRLIEALKEGHVLEDALRLSSDEIEIEDCLAG